MESLEQSMVTVQGGNGLLMISNKLKEVKFPFFEGKLA
jgi:hypothetical protein